VLAELRMTEEESVALHFKKMVLTLPDKRNTLEFTEVVPILLGLMTVRGVRRGQQEAVNQLFPPLNNALDHMEREHSEGMQYVDALIKHLGVESLVDFSLF
jgi:hypothetical protein